MLGFGIRLLIAQCRLRLRVIDRSAEGRDFFFREVGERQMLSVPQFCNFLNRVLSLLFFQSRVPPQVKSLRRERETVAGLAYRADHVPTYVFAYRSKFV